MNCRHIVRSGCAAIACLLLLVSAACGGGGGGGGGVIPPAPALTITKTVSPLSVPETGGNVTYTILINNTGDENVTVDTLTDNKFGNLAAVCLPAVIGTVLTPTPPNDDITCTFVKAMTGVSGTPHVNVATVDGTAASGGPVTDFDDATLTFTDVLQQATFTASNTSPAANTISMQAGASTGVSFDVAIQVTNIDDLFGVAFHVTYDAAVASFTGFSAGPLLGNPSAPFFDVADLGGGELAVVKTLQGAVAGVPNATGVLLTLSFDGIAAAANSPVAFKAGSRSVQVCPTAGGACSEFQGSVTWSGGTVAVN